MLHKCYLHTCLPLRSHCIYSGKRSKTPNHSRNTGKHLMFSILNFSRNKLHQVQRNLTLVCLFIYHWYIFFFPAALAICVMQQHSLLLGLMSHFLWSLAEISRNVSLSLRAVALLALQFLWFVALCWKLKEWTGRGEGCKILLPA